MNTTYNTKQKKLILSFLINNNDKQLTCEYISDNLKNIGTPVGKTTVYRYLEKLASDGKVRKIADTESKSTLYQIIDEDMNCESHLHLRCLGCGEFVHLGCDFMHGVNEHIQKHHNFTVDNTKTVIYGMCSECQSK